MACAVVICAKKKLLGPHKMGKALLQVTDDFAYLG